ncbi:MAG: NAD-dependent epimerase/dehydratase family protein, partial [bacterium]|nr:NAD-dependent epimerase/dehydratase family protein [bacterium]
MSALADKRVFVSGGAGVIGRELVAMLAAAGADVMVGDLAPCPASLPSDVAYRRGDLNHITGAELRAFDPQVFFHLAASFERSVETGGFWNEGHHNNLVLSHHLMDCMTGVESLERVVFASSYLVYDPALYTFDAPQSQPRRLDERAPIRPRNLCGSAKHHHELELEFLSDLPEVDFTAISARIYRSYGLGSRDIISRWVRSLLAGEALEVFGEQGCFDYVFARDVARALVELAVSDATGVANLATGKPRRVADVLAILARLFPDMRTRSVPSDIAYEAAAADVTRLREQTGYVPGTTLEEGIAEIVAWERSRSHKHALPVSMPDTGARDVLITSISKKIPLIQCVRRALAKFDPGARVHGADSDSEALGQHFVDVFWVAPSLDRDAGAGLIEHCRRNGIRFLIPTRDGELLFFSRLR